MELPPKFKIELPYDPAIPLLSIYPQRIQSRDSEKYLHTHFHSSTVQNSQEVEETQMSIRGWMDKQNVVLTTMEYYSALKRKEILTHRQHGWTLRTLCSVKEARHSRTNTIWFHLYELPRVVRFIETEVDGGRGEGVGSYRLMGIDFQFGKMRRVLGMDDVDGGTKMWMYLMPLKCTPKND